MLRPGDRIDRYIVEHHLGQGGQAVVWCVRHELLGTRKALKILIEPNPSTRRRLLQEGRTQGHITHPNVLPVDDVFETPLGLALVMPLVQGPTLQQVLDGKGVEPYYAAGLLRGIAHGVAAAHAKGIVHRDLKPPNVLLEPGPGGLVPRVADFGLAKLLDVKGHTGVGAVFGTPGYSAPEQLEDSSRAARGADAWALGVIGYELLTGKRPFPAVESEAVLELAALGEWERPHELGLDARWDEILGGLLHPDPAARTDVATLAEQLEHMPGGLPPTAWVGGLDSDAAVADRLGLPTERMEYLPQRSQQSSPGAAPTMVPDAPWSDPASAPAPSQWSLSSGALQQPPVHRRIHVVAAFEDRARVEHEVRKLRALGYSVPWVPPPAPAEGELDPATKRNVVEAEEVWVFWSVAARRDPHVKAQLALAEHLAGRRADAGMPTGRNYLIGRPLDDALLPAALDTRPGRPALAVWLAVGGTMLAMFAAAQLHASWLTWIGLVLALGFAVSAAALQWMRHPDLLLRVGRLHGLGKRLASARLPDIIALAEETLDAIFGDRLVSWRSLRVSAIISTVWAVPLWVMWIGSGFGTALLEGQPALHVLLRGGVFAAISLITTVPLFFGNIVFDYASLLATRTVLRRIVANPTPLWLIAGLFLDVVIVTTCALGAAYTNAWGVLVTYKATGSIAAWLAMIVTTTTGLFSGELSHNLIGDMHLSNALASAATMVTAAVPSLVHGSMLALALLNRLARGRLLRGLGEVLRRLADTPKGPWSLVAPAITAVVAATLFFTPGRAPSPPPHELAQGTFSRIDPEVCGTPCTIGCPEGELACEEHQQQRPVARPAPFAIGQTEVVQGIWTAVWDHGGDVVPDRFGLPRNPSVYDDPSYPVDSVTWCNALRFANLWTLVEGARTGRPLTPVYGSVDGGDPALPDCEAEGAARSPSGYGFRIPTEAEWEIAARGGTTTAWWSGDRVEDLLAVDWVALNSGWSPHPARTAPDPERAAKHPFGLYGVHGNVIEWTWDAYGIDPDAPSIVRVFRGGCVYSSAADARSSFRLWYRSLDRFLLRGLRLVAPSDAYRFDADLPHEVGATHEPTRARPGARDAGLHRGG